MKIVLLTSKSCNCVAIEDELQALDLAYERCDVERDPAIAARFGIRHCPTLIIEDRHVIAIDETNITQLRQLLAVD